MFFEGEGAGSLRLAPALQLRRKCIERRDSSMGVRILSGVHFLAKKVDDLF